ncbi:MAG: DUF5115 domain-containing protein [Bacteroidaceae bacterium]|nr:DUF5115 domain-containing protein [Bacteroidaceae bacterium]
MRKLLYCAAAALLGLTACTEDYKDWKPQTQPTQPATVTFGDGSITEVATIDLNALPEGQTQVKVATIVAPTASADGYTPSYTIAIGDKTYDIDADGLMDVAELQTYVNENFGRRPVERQIPATISMWVANGTTAVKSATSGTFNISVIPEAPQIASAYYIIGGPNSDWAGSAAAKSIKFSHSDQDVYEDPVFTVVFDAVADGDTWFAIGSDEACDAITTSGDWSKLLGTTSGNGNSGDAGILAPRSSLSDDGSFKVAAGAKKIKVTINMMEYSYKVEAVNIAENYYVVGGTLDWAASAASKAQKFSRSDKDLFEDPYFTIIIPANAGGDTWFAIADDEACDAITNNGDWSKLYGTTAGNGQNGATGSLARRTDLSDDGSLKYSSSAAQIKIVINMLEGTFAISDVAPQYYMVGALPGWNEEGARKALLYPTSASVMTYTSKYTGAWDLKIWNANDLGNWDNCYGCVVDGCSDATGALISSGAQAISAPSAEFYTFTFDLGTMTYTWTKLDNQTPTEYEAIGIIGDFNGWGGDIDMSQVTPHNWYAEATVTGGGLKFRANHDWAVNWGAELTVDEGSFYATGTNGGANIQVPEGNYAFYLNDITGQFAIVKR